VFALQDQKAFCHPLGFRNDGQHAVQNEQMIPVSDIFVTAGEMMIK